MTQRIFLCAFMTFITLPVYQVQAQTQRTATTGQSARIPPSLSGPASWGNQTGSLPSNKEAELLQEGTEIESELTRRTSDHRLLISELKTLLTTAKNEKAKQTQQQINDLINKRETQHKERIRHLEDKLQRIKAAITDLTQRRKAQHRVGTTAPNFSLNTFNAQKINLGDDKGKIVVLEWMNPACPFSKYYYRSKIIKTLIDKYAERDVVWLAVNSTPSQNSDLTTNFIDTYGITHPVLNDPDGKVAKLYYIQATPQAVIIDKTGKIAYSGAIDNSFSKPVNGKAVSFVDKALTELIAGQPVTLPYTVPIGTKVEAGLQP